MKPHVQRGCPERAIAFIMSIDDYLELSRFGSPGDFDGTTTPTRAHQVADHVRDAHDPDCAAFGCERVSEVVFVMLSAPTIVIPFCEEHTILISENYADLMQHLPEMTPEAQAPFFDDCQPNAPRAHSTPNRDEAPAEDDKR